MEDEPAVRWRGAAPIIMHLYCSNTGYQYYSSDSTTVELLYKDFPEIGTPL